MKDSIIPTAASASYSTQPTLLTRLARHAVLARLRDLRHGEVAIVESGERHLFGTPTEVCHWQ